VHNLFGNLKLIVPALQAFFGPFLKTLGQYKFELATIAIVYIVILLLLFNSRELIKLFYTEIFSKRIKRVSYQLETQPASSNILKKTLYLLKILTRRIFNITAHTADSVKGYKEMKVLNYRIRLPYLSVLAGKFIFVNIFFLLAIFLIAKKYILIYPNFTVVYPTENEVWDNFRKPIEIVFEGPINKNDLIINMSPETDGEWVFEKSFSFLPFYRKALFYPKETIMPGNKVMIYLTDLNNYFELYPNGEHLITLQSLTLPEIVSITPAEQAVDVPVEEDIIITLNQNDGYYVEWDFEFNRDVKYQQVRGYSNEVRLRFDEPLKQGKDYELKVYLAPVTTDLESGEILKRGKKSLVKTIKFKTVTPPLIESLYPEGTGILPNDKIKIVFDQPMVKDSVEQFFTIKPETTGELIWEDKKTFVFQPASLNKETHYEVELAKGIKSLAGGLTEEKITYGFDTIGKVKVIGWIPYYNSSGISVSTNINVTFDQSVDKASAESNFSISPSISGSYSWNGNTMIFHPSANLKYSTTYTVTIAAGIKTVNGLDSAANFTMPFTTEHQTIILNVPQYYQTHAFTCNITAATMALGYKGVSASEMSVYNGIAKDSTACKKDATGKITVWGNPHSGYVGSIDGTGDCGGYGVYWGPVSSYMSSRGVSNQVFSGWSVSTLAKEIEKGHPAVVWGQNGWSSPYDKSWDTPGGTRIYAINGMHSEVAVGFIGPSSNPTHIITNDPWRGRRTHTVAQFNVFWSYFGHTGIVIY